LVRTAVITLLCGIGHVGSSVALGFVGVALGIAADELLLSKIQGIEEFRGSIAAWLLIGFGFAYFLWGLHRAIRNRPHTHLHVHGAGDQHEHEHSHSGEHAHPHTREAKINLTPWVLFTIFVFGPCEPLIPLIMAPAALHNYFAVALVATIFSVVTIGTMLIVVLAGSYGLKLLPMGRLERYSHALAGLAIGLSGMAVQFLGL